MVTASLGTNGNVRMYPDKNVEKMELRELCFSHYYGFSWRVRNGRRQPKSAIQLVELARIRGSWNEQVGLGLTDLSFDPSLNSDESTLPG